MSGCFLGSVVSPFGTRTTSRSAASNAQVTLTAQGGKPRVNVVWHKMSDLRLHDHEALARAHLETPRTLTDVRKKMMIPGRVVWMDVARDFLISFFC